MRLVALVAPFALVAALTTGAWAAPGDPVPVRATPRVVEDTPTSHGAWLGWEQRSREDPSHGNYFVRRGTQAPVRVNAFGTEASGGGIAGHRVYYVQQFRDRRPRMIALDLRTGDRAPLPPKVNHHRHVVPALCCGGPDDKDRVLSWAHGDVTVSGPWLLYSGYTEVVDGGNLYDTAVLYNRARHRLRTLSTRADDSGIVWAGQVNGRYATYWWVGRYGGENFYRYDIRTGQTAELPLPDDSSADPAVSSDGTVYYFHSLQDQPAEGTDTFELVRQPVDGAAEVVTTLTTATRHGASLHVPGGTFVRDRPDGSRVVFFQWREDIYKLVDRPPA